MISDENMEVTSNDLKPDDKEMEVIVPESTVSDSLKTVSTVSDSLKIVSDSLNTVSTVSDSLKIVSDSLNTVLTVSDSLKTLSTVSDSLNPVSDSLNPVLTVSDSLNPVSTVSDSLNPVSTVSDTLNPVSTVSDSLNPVSTVSDSLNPVLTVSDSEPEENKMITDDTHHTYQILKPKKVKRMEKIQQNNMRKGLDTPLGPPNKGFAIMVKMGYKMGMSLGKDGSGITEPLPIVLKQNKNSLGFQVKSITERKVKKEKIPEISKSLKKRERKILNLEEKQREIDYFTNLNKKQLRMVYTPDKIENDLTKARTVCYEKDKENGILTPHEFWFWPSSTWNELAEPTETGQNQSETPHLVDSCVQHEPLEQLEILTNYLRVEYHHCIWCYTPYEYYEALEHLCPGPNNWDHIW